MRRTPRTAKAAAALLGLALIGAACGGDNSSSSPTTAAGGATTTGASGASTTAGGATTSAASAGATNDTYTYAYEQEFSAYNPNTSTTNASKNAIPLDAVLPDAFVLTDKGTLEMDKNLLDSAELTSTSPQTVKYVVNAKAAWSDGTPIGCDDFYLQWLAQRGEYKQKNADGSVKTDADSGAELDLFDSAGTAGFENISKLECSADGKTITTTYSTPFADWNSLFTGMVPAHIAAKTAGVADIQAADTAKDEAALGKLAAVWNTGWVLNPGELKPDIMPSGDAYSITSWQAGQQLTLTRNDSYWGPPAVAKTIVIRFIPQEAQAQALANKEIQAMDPQPNPDLVSQLKGMSGVTSSGEQQYTFEHVDFNYKNPELAKLEVRQAFAKCLPRQQIVDNLIKPQNPDAIVMNSSLRFPFEADYTDNSGGKYDAVDIPGAKALLDGAGASGLALRIGYFTPNQRRTNEVELIKASCEQAGFKITDAGSETFFDDELPNGNFDVALFAWAGSPVKASLTGAYQTGQGNNQGFYSNPEADKLVDSINSSLDPKARASDINKLDSTLWTDLPTIPIFAFPGIVAFEDTMQNVVYNPTQAGLLWNVPLWQKAA